jgi:CrcB protein
MHKVALVALGGAFGAVSRYLITYLSAQKFGTGFPYGTLLVNVIGCLFAGVLVGIITEKALPDEGLRLLLLVGFAGGLTTFSSFSLDTISLLQHQQYLLSFANICGNMLLGLAATFLGIFLVRFISHSFS